MMKSFKEYMLNESAKTTYRSKTGEDLEIDFDPSAKLEINLGKDVEWGKMISHYKEENPTWVVADPDTFRSWKGERRVNGKTFHGKVYDYLSNNVSGEDSHLVKAGDTFLMTYPRSQYVQRNGSQPVVVSQGDKIRIAKTNVNDEGDHLAYIGLQSFYINDDELAKFKKVNESHQNLSNYMFFQNLENMKRKIEEIQAMDVLELDDILSQHDWATDHISSAKDDIDEVYDFLCGKEMYTK
jgi:hypothetical protein